jgi:transposase
MQHLLIFPDEEVPEVGDWSEFGSGRGLAAWIGLVATPHTNSGKDRLDCITKQRNRYFRWLLVTGAMAVIRYARMARRSGRGSHG